MIHRVSVSLAGASALEILGREERGAVLSSHRAGLYCRLAGGPLLLIHDQSAGVIPFGLGCAPPLHPQGWKALEPGTPVTVSHAEKCLLAGEFRFMYGNAATPRIVFPWERTAPDPSRLRAGVAEAAERFTDPERQGIAAAYLLRREALFAGREPDHPLNDLWEKAVWEPLQRLLLRCLEQGDADGAGPGAFATALVGLGPGLTPLADDILCGLFAAGFALKKPFPCRALARLTEEAAPAVAHAAAKLTTSQSAAFVRSAAAGERFGMLDAVIAAVCANTAPEREKAFAAVLNVGHSSGCGLVLGLLLAIELAVRDLSAI